MDWRNRYTYVFSHDSVAVMTQRRPTSFDIAALAGVSQPTVSRALSGNASVSEATRARVLAAAEQLSYTVDKNASGLRRRHSHTLALLFFEEPSSEGALINRILSIAARADGSALRRARLRPADLVPAAVVQLAPRLRGQPQGRRHHPARLWRLPRISAQARAIDRARSPFRALGRGDRGAAGNHGLVGQRAGRFRRDHPFAPARPAQHRFRRHRRARLPGISRAVAGLLPGAPSGGHFARPGPVHQFRPERSERDRGGRRAFEARDEFRRNLCRQRRRGDRCDARAAKFGLFDPRRRRRRGFRRHPAGKPVRPRG